MDNLVDVGIATVEIRNFLWDHAEHVYWRLALPKNYHAGLMNYDN